MLRLRDEIEKIVDYLDKTIKANNATEPNALYVKNLLQKALEETI